MINDNNDSDDFNYNNIKELIPTFSSEKLCEIIVCDRYLSIFKDIAVLCMQELSNRRINGDTFDFESFIDNSIKELPNLESSLIDINGIIKQAINKTNFNE